MGTPSGGQRLKVLVVDDESHPARPRGHAVRHLVPRSEHGGWLNHDVVRLERGVREVEAIHLAPRVLLGQVLVTVRHQAGVKDQRIFVLKELVRNMNCRQKSFDLCEDPEGLGMAGEVKACKKSAES